MPTKKFILTATIAASIAALASGCGPSQRSAYADNGYYSNRNTAICADRQGRRIADSYCQRGHNGGGGGMNAAMWYYMGRSSATPYMGERVGGGSFTRTRGATYFHAPAAANFTRSAAISRGGLGSSARGFSSFGGGGRSSFGSVGG